MWQTLWHQQILHCRPQYLHNIVLWFTALARVIHSTVLVLINEISASSRVEGSRHTTCYVSFVVLGIKSPPKSISIHYVLWNILVTELLTLHTKSMGGYMSVLKLTFSFGISASSPIQRWMEFPSTSLWMWEISQELLPFISPLIQRMLIQCIITSISVLWSTPLITTNPFPFDLIGR